MGGSSAPHVPPTNARIPRKARHDGAFGVSSAAFTRQGSPLQIRYRSSRGSAGSAAPHSSSRGLSHAIFLSVDTLRITASRGPHCGFHEQDEYGSSDRT